MVLHVRDPLVGEKQLSNTTILVCGEKKEFGVRAKAILTLCRIRVT